MIWNIAIIHGSREHPAEELAETTLEADSEQDAKNKGEEWFYLNHPEKVRQSWFVTATPATPEAG